MSIFTLRQGQLFTLSTLPFRYEKDLQKLIEDNLMSLLEVHYLASQYPMNNGGRIDTLGVDVNGSPVIIEYKRDRNGNVINQALSYLNALKSQKEEFFRMLMINKLGKNLADSIRLDWKHPRVICIAESFNRYDMDTVAVVPLRIELYRYCQYEAGIFQLEPAQVNEQQNIATPVQHGMHPSVFDILKKQVNASSQVQHLFDELRERILSIDDRIVEKTNRKGVAYVVARHFAEIQIKRDMLVIDLRPLDYPDPRNLVERIAIGYTLTMNRRIKLQQAGDLDYVFSIILKSYQDVL